MYRLGSPSLALSARLSRSPYPLRRHTALLHTTARLANRGFDVDEVVGPAAPGQDDTRQPGFKEKVKRDRIQAPKPNKPIDPVTRQRYTSANTPRQWDMSDRRTWRKPQSESAMVQGNKVVNNHARLPRYGTRSRFDPDHDVASKYSSQVLVDAVLTLLCAQVEPIPTTSMGFRPSQKSLRMTWNLPKTIRLQKSNLASQDDLCPMLSNKHHSSNCCTRSKGPSLNPRARSQGPQRIRLSPDNNPRDRHDKL